MIIYTYYIVTLIFVRSALGLDELHMYDLYTPLVTEVEMKVKYEEAKDYVIKGLKRTW